MNFLRILAVLYFVCGLGTLVVGVQNLICDRSILFVFSVPLAVLQWHRAIMTLKESCLRDSINRLRQLSLQVTSLIEETGISPSTEEIRDLIEGRLSITQLQELLLSRQAVLWGNHVKTNCLFFSKSIYLKCTVNPSQSCEECSQFQQKQSIYFLEIDGQKK